MKARKRLVTDPYPLEQKLDRLLSRGDTPVGWQPTGRTRDLYIELSEPIVRSAVPWQDADGLIVDPCDLEGIEGFPLFTAARFVGALGFLIDAGRCLDLVDVCARSLDVACRGLFHAHERPIRGADFYPKELMRGYLALRSHVAADRHAEWGRLLGGYEPLRNYTYVLNAEEPVVLHNIVTFAVAGEAWKRKHGLCDNTPFIEAHLETQLDRFTEFGMYRDPHDPLTYDFTASMNLSLMLHWGYDGAHAGFIDEMLRRGGLTTLCYMSNLGEAPFGGRSNQFNFTEATLAVLCEYEANRYKALGNLELAGRFKRAARLAAASVIRWLEMSPARFVKNGFDPESQHGRESRYGLYGIYLLLAASQFGFAHLLADDTIEERPLPYETDRILVHLPEAFHKIFATAGGYHLEIDTKADLHYDATGLGRIHRVSIPGELGLSTPIAADPGYLVSVDPAPRNVAIGPGWLKADGNVCWLADCSDEIRNVLVEVHRENSHGPVDFEVRYQGDLTGCERVTERYSIGTDGVLITDTVSGAKGQLLVQIPLLESNGLDRSEIKVDQRGFEVRSGTHRYRVECIFPSDVKTVLEPFMAPNRNGIYRVGCFQVNGNKIRYRLNLT